MSECISRNNKAGTQVESSLKSTKFLLCVIFSSRQQTISTMCLNQGSEAAVLRLENVFGNELRRSL